TDRIVRLSGPVVREPKGYRIGVYSDGPAAQSGFQPAPRDWAFLDPKVPRLHGADALRLLRAKSDLPVIFLTSTKEVIDEVFALEMGADDFIRKPFSQRLLVERVKAVLRRALPKSAPPPKKVTNKVLECGPLRMDVERHTCTWKNHRVRLTASEFLILHALASRPGVVKSRNALVGVAYNNPLNVDERSIDTHVKRLRKKFMASDSEFDSVQT